MDWPLLIGIGFIILWKFGDVLLALITRLVGFLLCVWLALTFQNSVAHVLCQLGLRDHPVAAGVLAFLLLLFTCASVFRWLFSTVASRELSAAHVIALDVTRVGLVLAITVALVVTLVSVGAGEVVEMPSAWKIAIAALAACVDVVFPSLLSRAAVHLGTESVESKGDVRC